jgi:hypothetical protein
MNVIRVFPTRTSQSPSDQLCFFGPPPMMLPEHTAVHVSVIFTWDTQKALWLKRQWECRTDKPVYIGGPALGERGEQFTPGLYMAPGITITSRGCPNKCWFCSVWRREGTIRELEIKPGHIIQDDNLLACSQKHIIAVFDMLSKQRKAAEFLGGMEAKLLKQWHVELMLGIRIKQMFFAYDTPNDLEPLRAAGRMLGLAGLNRNKLRCFVLMGQPGDTFDKCDKRMRETWDAGFMPQAMLYKNDMGDTDKSWLPFFRTWARPAIIKAKLR